MHLLPQERGTAAGGPVRPHAEPAMGKASPNSFAGSTPNPPAIRSFEPQKLFRALSNSDLRKPFPPAGNRAWQGAAMSPLIRLTRHYMMTPTLAISVSLDERHGHHYPFREESGWANRYCESQPLRPFVISSLPRSLAILRLRPRRRATEGGAAAASSNRDDQGRTSVGKPWRPAFPRAQFPKG
jgi:hypothetical protein